MVGRVLLTPTSRPLSLLTWTYLAAGLPCWSCTFWPQIAIPFSVLESTWCGTLFPSWTYFPAYRTEICSCITRGRPPGNMPWKPLVCTCVSSLFSARTKYRGGGRTTRSSESAPFFQQVMAPSLKACLVLSPRQL